MAIIKKGVGELAPFEPLPWQIPPLDDTNKVMLLGGSAGGGKSRLASEKIHAFLLFYPGATAVVSRKIRDAMSKSTVPLIMDTVINIEKESRCYYRAREDRIIYKHHNGNDSELIFTGMHNKQQRESTKSIGKSGSVDIWWMEEATDFDEDDFNFIIRGIRGTAAPWQQIILTTNPGPKLHWINRRLIKGEEAAYYPSHAIMNPHNPLDYQERLETITGVNYKRLVEGIWTDGEGLVIDTWKDDHSGQTGIEPKGNVTPAADYIPNYGRVVWYVDDGYGGEQDDKTGWFTEKSSPRVFLLAQERRDGTIAVFAEHLRVQTLADKHIHSVVKMSEKNRWPMPKYAIYDGAAPALGGEFKRYGIKAKPVRCKIDDGLDELRSWVGADRNKVRRFIVHPRCQYFRWEMESYTYDDEGRPIDAFNHTVDAARYGVWYKSHGPSQRVRVMAPGVDREKIDIKVAEVMARLREKYENAGIT